MHRSGNQIRSRLYLELGLLKNRPQACSTTGMDATASAAEPSRRSCLRKQTSVLHKKRARNVSFRDSVKVRTIPSHREFDQTTWDSMWITSEVAHMERQRNRFEFWADGGDWRTAVEEDAMVPGLDGRLFHPATYARIQAYQTELYYDFTDNHPSEYARPRLPSYRKTLKRRRYLSTTGQPDKPVAANTEKFSPQYPREGGGEEEEDEEDEAAVGAGSTTNYPYCPYWKDTSTYKLLH
jgi:hypothetical protein